MHREFQLQDIALQTAQMKRKSNLISTQPKKKQKTTDHNQIVVLKRDVRALKQANETHVFDQNIFGAFTTTLISGVWPSAGACLNCPIQGDTVFNRQGSEVKGVGFSIKGNLLFHPGEINQTTCRLMVYLDKQNNGTANNTILTPSANALIDVTTCVDAVYAPQYIVNKKRFKILYNKVFNNQPAVVTDYDPVTGNTSTVAIRSAQFNIWIPWKGITEFNAGNAATAADIQTNAVRFLVFSESPTISATNFMSVSMAARFFFKEA